MKVLMVTDERAADRRYGAAKSLIPVIDELRGRAIDVDYLCQDDMGARAAKAMAWLRRSVTRACECRLIIVGTGILFYGVVERINMGRLASKIARRDGYTHVHCHDPIIACGVWLFSATSRRRFLWGVSEHGFGTYIQAVHEDSLPLTGAQMRLLRRLELSVVRRASWVISPNGRALAALARDLAAYPIPDHWHAIPHSRPPIGISERGNARTVLGWHETAFYVIGVGRLATVKQFDVLIRAFAAVRHKDARLVIVGGGDTASLQRVAADAQVSNRVSFAISDNIGSYYAAADLYVSASASESFGLANFEALCAGVPTIVSAAGAVPDVMATASYLVPPGDIGSLSAAMQELVDSPALRARLVRRGLARVACWPSAAEVAHYYVQAYEGATHIDPKPDCKGVVREFSAARQWRPVIEQLAICPLPRLLALPTGERVLVFAPHPDDAVFACGGTLALLREKGCQIRVIIMTDGGLVDPLSQLTGAHRYQESRAALAALGITDLDFYHEPDQGLFPSHDLVEKVRRSIDEFRPDLLFLPPLLDFHRDHVAGSLAVLEAWYICGCVGRAFMWERWQPLPISCVVDITSVFEHKQRAAASYSTALDHSDCGRATRGLASYRALYLEHGSYAEGFLELDEKSVWSVTDQLLGLRAAQEEARADPTF